MKNDIINNTTINTANTNNTMTTNTNSKGIICIETNEFFPSVRKAAEHFNVSAASVSNVLTGRAKSVKGNHFRYATKEEIEVNTHDSIICVETGKTYKTMTEVAKDVGCSIDLISSVFRGKVKTAKGFHFKYINDTEVTNPKENEPTPEVEAPIDPDIPKEIIVQHKAVVKGKGKRMNGNTKSTFDFTTGSFYTSATDMAEHLNTTQGHISFACRHKGRTVKGHKVCYVRDINEHLDEIGNAIRKANMYDDVMTKEEKRKEMLALLVNLECKASCIEYEMENLSNELDKTNAEIEKVKNDLIYFKF